jgi:SAM-dependent methyltransferase
MNAVTPKNYASLRPFVWFYERVIAPGIEPLFDSLADTFFTNLRAGARVLDVGCGSGYLAWRIAARNPQAEAFGIDVLPSQIERAGVRVGGLSNLQFRVGDAMNLEFADAHFDRVVSVTSIKHWPDPVRGLREMGRVCRPGGQLWVVEINADCTLAEVRAFVSLWKKLPAFLHRPLSWFFHKGVVRQGLGEAHLRELCAQGDWPELQVQKSPGGPAILGLAFKPAK